MSRRDVCQSASPGSVPQLPWIPQTTAAVALRLLELDSAIAYALLHKDEPHNQDEVEDFIVESFLSFCVPFPFSWLGFEERVGAGSSLFQCALRKNYWIRLL